MIHLQASKPFVIHPKSQIDKHIKILKELKSTIKKEKYVVSENKQHQPILMFDVEVQGSVGLKVAMMRQKHMDNPVSIGRFEDKIVVFVGSIPNSLKLSWNLPEEIVEKLVENVRKIMVGLASDEISMMAHEATHMIDLSTFHGKYQEGSDYLPDNFEEQNWFEMNALFNQVVYLHPDALESTDKFVNYFTTDEDINYEQSEKMVTIHLPEFQEALKSLIKS